MNPSAKPYARTRFSVWRSGTSVGLVALSLALLSGCSTQVLGSLAAAALTSSQTAALQERAEQQALASSSAVTEKVQEVETQSSYLQVIAQMQRKQLWFASLAHLDAMEAKWGISADSQLMRADALRHVGMHAESSKLYEQLSRTAASARARHGLGLLAAQAQRYGEAVAHLQAARNLSPTDALLLNDLGFALLHTEQAESARIPLMQATQLQPSHPRIQSNVALYLLLYGNESQATEWMHQHQMTEPMRMQVFAQAQRLAARSTLSRAQPQPTELTPHPPEIAQRMPSFYMPHAPTPAPSTEQHLASISSSGSASWMTESPSQGMKP